MKKWESKMNEQREMKKKGAAVLYHRVKLLVECYDDKQFLAWCDESRIDALDYLDRELEDTVSDFLSLRAVYEQFGKEEDWQRLGVRAMIAEVLDCSRKDREVIKRGAWKDRAIAAEKECERLRAEIEKLREIVEILQGRKAA